MNSPNLLAAMPFTAADAAREVQKAEPRIRDYIRETPVEYSPVLSRDTGARVFLKLEHTQVTGSFKARGAFKKLLSLTSEERARGVVTASTGNHALATTYALEMLGISGEIFLPQSASPVKIDALRLRGANLRLVDDDAGTVEVIARREANQTGRLFVSPYNDPEIIGGQGTIGLELLRQRADFQAVFVPVGGGGLIAGIAGHIKTERPRIRVIGCQPAASPILARSVEAGRVLELPSDATLSDATAGLVERDAITFPICQQCVDEWPLVNESDLRSAIRLLVTHHSLLVEGAGALSVAAFLRTRDRYRDQTVVLVLSGAHIVPATLARILAESG